MKQTRLLNMILLFAFVSCACIVISCGSDDKKDQPVSNIAYPGPPPDSIAISFLPGIVSTDSLDFNAAFSPDGKSFYFSRASNGVSKIFMTHYDGNKWNESVAASFAIDGAADADPAFGPDSNLYFISNRPSFPGDTLLDYDIWMVKREGDKWSAPENVQYLNSDSNEFYISFSRNGNIYFSSSCKGGFGQEDIYVSKLENEKYTAPENLGSTINTDKSEYDPGIAPDEKMLLFASSKRDNGYGMADLYCAIPNEKMLWTQSIHLDTTINSATRDYCPYFSPDGKYFFFTSNKDVKWVNMQGLRAAIKQE
jgi:Tol biopolymer transport system component